MYFLSFILLWHSFSAFCRIIVVQSDENPDKDTISDNSTLTASTSLAEMEPQGSDMLILAGHEAMQL